MKFYLTQHERAVVVLNRMKEDDGKVGDYLQVILPGEHFSGIPFKQLHSFAENNGWIEIEENLS